MINIISVSYTGHHPREDSGDSVAVGDGCMQKRREVHQSEWSIYAVAGYGSTASVQEMEGKVCIEPEWRVGRYHLNVDTLVLVSLQRVSHGSWMATIRLG